MNFVNLFISPSGRINRAKFWIAVLILAAIGVLFAAMVVFSGEGKGAIIVNAIVSLLIAAAGILIGIKRLHDRNKSGWWILLFYVAPFVMLSIGYAAGTDSLPSNILGLLALAIYLWSLIELGCLRGTIGQNKYGPDPLAPDVLTPPVRTHA
ncbi:MAG: DUF805 domain-containing protein [Xanthobacteraceae bacterium]|nr:DUF805 domain-containing protein [Xanthobacteraceae bacterium]